MNTTTKMNRPDFFEPAPVPMSKPVVTTTSQPIYVVYTLYFGDTDFMPTRYTSWDDAIKAIRDRADDDREALGDDGMRMRLVVYSKPEGGLLEPVIAATLGGMDGVQYRIMQV